MEGIVVVLEFFKMERNRGAVVTLVPSGDREALMKSLPESNLDSWKCM